VAALAGALSAALVAMVGNLTVGRRRFREREDLIRPALGRACQLRDELLSLVEKDALAFDEVMRALRMPRDTDAQKAERALALDSALAVAAEVPMRTAELCVECARLAKVMREHGNPRAASDAEVAALLAVAGVQAAILNVEINLESLKDQQRKESLRQRVAAALAELDEAKFQVSQG